MFIEQLKDDLHRVILASQEEYHSEVEEVMSKLNEDLKLHIEEECFDECGLESESDDDFFSRSMLDG